MFHCCVKLCVCKLLMVAIKHRWQICKYFIFSISQWNYAVFYDICKEVLTFLDQLLTCSNRKKNLQMLLVGLQRRADTISWLLLFFCIIVKMVFQDFDPDFWPKAINSDPQSVLSQKRLLTMLVLIKILLLNQ